MWCCQEHWNHAFYLFIAVYDPFLFSNIERGLGDVELGTKMGTSASPDFISKLKEVFEKEGIECNIEHIGFTGGDIIEYHSNPPFVEAVQIEISRTLREYYREKIVDILSRFIKRIIMEDRDGR